MLKSSPAPFRQKRPLRPAAGRRGRNGPYSPPPRPVKRSRKIRKTCALCGKIESGNAISMFLTGAFLCGKHTSSGPFWRFSLPVPVCRPSGRVQRAHGQQCPGARFRRAAAGTGRAVLLCTAPAFPGPVGNWPSVWGVFRLRCFVQPGLRPIQPLSAAAVRNALFALFHLQNHLCLHGASQRHFGR